MFCPKCGKEMGDGLRFCGVCGFDTAVAQQATAQTRQRQQTMAVQEETLPGTETAVKGDGADSANTLSSEQTAKYQAMYEEAESSLVKLENKSNMLALIGKIILVVTEALLLTQAIPKAENFIGVLAVAIFGIVPFYCYVYVVRAGLGIKKRKVVGEYVDALSGRSMKEIADMWETSACPDIKAVNYNPYQNIVTIHSKLWGEAEVKQQEGHTTLVWLKGKDNGFAQSTLAAYLVKQINPSLNLDAHKVYKNNKFWKHVEWICGWLIIGAVIIAFGMMFMGVFGGQQYVSVVKDSAPDGYNITYGKAFDKVFEKGEWEYFETDDKMMIVDYTGTKNGRKIQLQWKLTPKDGDLVEYELYAAEIDGESVTRLEAGLLLLAIMEGTSLDDELSGYGSLLDNKKVEKSDSIQTTEGQNIESESAEFQSGGSVDVYENPYENLAGTWTDMNRCYITMERTGDIFYHITVQWWSSAGESSWWEMDAQYISEDDALLYENGVSWIELYDDNGNESHQIVYTDGIGWFWIYDNMLYWTSNEEADGIVEYSFYRE